MAELDQFLETQKPRLFDMFALGPFMIWYATKSKDMGIWPRRTLFVAGVMTIIYNWKNYRNAKEILSAKFAEVQAASDKVAVVISRPSNFLNQ